MISTPGCRPLRRQLDYFIRLVLLLWLHKFSLIKLLRDDSFSRLILFGHS